MRPDDDVETDLGLLLSAIREHAGHEGLEKAFRSIGGTAIYVPAQPAQDNPLVKLFGIEIASAICSDLKTGDARGKIRGLGNIIIPRGRYSRRALLTADMGKLLLTGEASVPEIARLVGCHERTVWRRKAELVRDKRLKRDYRSVRPITALWRSIELLLLTTELNPRDIANRLGCTPTTVYRHLHRMKAEAIELLPDSEAGKL